MSNDKTRLAPPMGALPLRRMQPDFPGPICPASMQAGQTCSADGRNCFVLRSEARGRASIKLLVISLGLKKARLFLDLLKPQIETAHALSRVLGTRTVNDLADESTRLLVLGGKNWLHLGSQQAAPKWPFCPIWQPAMV
jgi:hypothetical protein